MDFQTAVMECYDNKEFVREFNRLTDNNLKQSRDKFIEMIDNACGYNPDEKGMIEFIQFVEEFIWMPLIAIPQ